MIPKLRAWKKYDSPEMFRDIAFIDFNKKLLGVNYKVSKLTTRLDIETLDKFILMQSTGLKDKNGIEIYEGDVVRHSPILTDISIIKYGEFGVPNFETESYQETALGWYFENASDLKDIAPFNMTVPVNNEYIKGIEVIGNVYENPELLEGHEK